mgnify:CR=1 FL=1
MPSALKGARPCGVKRPILLWRRGASPRVASRGQSRDLHPNRNTAQAQPRVSPSRASPNPLTHQPPHSSVASSITGFVGPTGKEFALRVRLLCWMSVLSALARVLAGSRVLGVSRTPPTQKPLDDGFLLPASVNGALVFRGAAATLPDTGPTGRAGHLQSWISLPGLSAMRALCAHISPVDFRVVSISLDRTYSSAPVCQSAPLLQHDPSGGSSGGPSEVPLWNVPLVRPTRASLLGRSPTDH